jgi:hypothetical protein
MPIAEHPPGMMDGPFQQGGTAALPFLCHYRRIVALP